MEQQSKPSSWTLSFEAPIVNNDGMWLYTGEGHRSWRILKAPSDPKKWPAKTGLADWSTCIGTNPFNLV